MCTWSVHHWQKWFILYSAHAWLALTLHQEFCHRLATICFNLVVAAVFLCDVINDQDVFAAIFLEAILERLVSCQFHTIFLPAQTEKTQQPKLLINYYYIGIWSKFWAGLLNACLIIQWTLKTSYVEINLTSKALLLFLELSTTCCYDLPLIQYMTTWFYSTEGPHLGLVMTTKLVPFAENNYSEIWRT